jgi:hypothetical protein
MLQTINWFGPHWYSFFDLRLNRRTHDVMHSVSINAAGTRCHGNKWSKWSLDQSAAKIGNLEITFVWCCFRNHRSVTELNQRSIDHCLTRAIPSYYCATRIYTQRWFFTVVFSPFFPVGSLGFGRVYSESHYAAAKLKNSACVIFECSVSLSIGPYFCNNCTRNVHFMRACVT